MKQVEYGNNRFIAVKVFINRWTEKGENVL